MDGAGEIFQAGPKDLAVGEVPQLAALEEVARPLAHVQEEAEVAPLDVRLGIAPLEDFDHARHFQIGPQRGQHEEVVGQIGPPFLAAGARVRRHQHAFRRGEALVQEPGVPGLGLGVVAEVGKLEVDLILQGQLVFFVDGPDGPPHRGQRGNNPAEEFTVELPGTDVPPRQLLDLLDQGLDLPLGLFDELLLVVRLFDAHGHVLPGPS